jgi:cytochrome c-type biogenesis protein CcmH/NrfF
MMNCSGHATQTEKVRRLIAEGKTHDEIIAIFVRDAGGQDILASPINEGFNRLAWLLPYGVALVALIGILMAARRWSQPGTRALAGDAGVDPALNARLDDELRNLD